ncbi:pantetheine-phosphate adenylyltransferase [Egicoccus halophilus]|uniref:Phosphopantetheine adenylyltransferase n=1 Tax=Egicoccus halophilus TaxID=1670830 RepID=A0A8J3A843_9ACTN|nr:pantetheine-phosphate adenylyltransferase [Egicoccus halophilus]GGI06448.1 phosphopantetheine adenylyltransferase [Egicoccus halophilus]
MTVAAVVPGSFDPITLGHLDIVARACARFDRVVVAVLENPRKQGLFTVDERVSLIHAVTGDLDNLEVDRFEGLLVDFCNARDIGIVCKGLRAVSDFEYELQMAQMNHRIGDVETVFLSTSPEHSYLSSSLVKEVARFGGPLDGTVPDVVAEALRGRFAGPAA